MAVSIALVALGADAKISIADVQRDLNTNWSNLPDAEGIEEKDGIFSFRISGSDIFLASMQAPIPWSDLEGPCATSILWPDAAKQLREHKSHWMVTISADSPPVERAKLLTQVTAAVIGTCPAAIGVYWGGAALVIPRKIFLAFATKILPQGPPIQIWVDFRVGRNPQGKSSGFTQGLAPLGFMELETENSSESPAKLRERLSLIATYLLEKGPVIRDRDTIGEDKKERIRVVYSKSAFGHPKTVMRLDYEAI
ncbi:MAG TPA: DUF4261 domain-containing protein [Terriglobales bacterium]|nr:DUF4261 domain-containing protein [Terriglobales bacterium]